MSFDPIRDCRHGRLNGRCDTCSDEDEIADLRARLAAAEAERDDAQRQLTEGRRLTERALADARNAGTMGPFMLQQAIKEACALLGWPEVTTSREAPSSPPTPAARRQPW